MKLWKAHSICHVLCRSSGNPDDQKIVSKSFLKMHRKNTGFHFLNILQLFCTLRTVFNLMLVLPLSTWNGLSLLCSFCWKNDPIGVCELLSKYEQFSTDRHTRLENSAFRSVAANLPNSTSWCILLFIESQNFPINYVQVMQVHDQHTQFLPGKWSIIWKHQ